MNERWLKFWNRLSRADGNAVFPELDRRYSEDWRRYHNWDHISRCLAELELCRKFCRHPDALELALWFHDSVYETGSRENEAQSAVLAETLLADSGLDEEFIRMVRDLILSTVPLSQPPRPLVLLPDVEYIHDIDFTILGSSEDVYHVYRTAIRGEYPLLDDESFRKGRRAFLSALLDAGRIYRTAFFFKRYEGRARENIRRELLILDQREPDPVPEELP